MVVKLDGKEAGERWKGKRSMKKKLVALMLGVMLVLPMAACGSGKENAAAEGTEITEDVETTEQTERTTAASSAFDLKGSDYVTLCDYDDISITITGDYEVEDEDVTDSFADMFTNYGPFYRENPDKTVISEGDIVNVDYVGKLDGEAFEGGSAENQNIDVYKNASAAGGGYIDGFTDGLKGAKVGDVLDCDVTFPEDYGNADLAGKDVVFTFTVNSIQKEMTLADVDDAFAKEQFQVETVEEMYQTVRESLEQQAEYYKKRDTYQGLQAYLMDNSVVEVPEEYLEARVSDYKRQYVDYYCQGDESQLASQLSTYEGKTLEEAQADWKANMEKSIRLELIMDAIAQELELTVKDAEYEDYVELVVKNSGYESADAMYALYGYGDTAYGARYFKELYLYDQALEEVLAHTTVNVDPTLAESEARTEAVEETEAE